MKKELPAEEIPEEVHLKAMATARTFMGLSPLSEKELKKRVDMILKTFKK